MAVVSPTLAVPRRDRHCRRLRVAIAQHDFESASEPQPHLLHRANLQVQLVATQWPCRGHLWCAFVEELPAPAFSNTVQCWFIPAGHSGVYDVKISGLLAATSRRRFAYACRTDSPGQSHADLGRAGNALGRAAANDPRRCTDQ